MTNLDFTFECMIILDLAICMLRFVSIFIFKHLRYDLHLSTIYWCWCSIFSTVHLVKSKDTHTYSRFTSSRATFEILSCVAYFLPHILNPLLKVPQFGTKSRRGPPAFAVKTGSGVFFQSTIIKNPAYGCRVLLLMIMVVIWVTQPRFWKGCGGGFIKPKSVACCC
jgi:hypothetical protein